MNKKEDQLQNQDAPLKNTDQAYVKVGKDGNPVYPEEKQDVEQKNNTGERVTDFDKR